MNEKIIPHYIARFAQLFGFLDEKKYRDYCIREEFDQLKNFNQLTVENIEIRLSEKYCLSPETIHGIVYKK